MKRFKPTKISSGWRKATRSIANAACVEVRPLEGIVAVRDSKNPQGPVLTYTQEEWETFLEGAKRGKFDLAS
jgi:Domain of unknown function (DUF397)